MANDGQFSLAVEFFSVLLEFFEISGVVGAVA